MTLSIKKLQKIVINLINHTNLDQTMHQSRSNICVGRRPAGMTPTHWCDHNTLKPYDHEETYLNPVTPQKNQPPSRKLGQFYYQRPFVGHIGRGFSWNKQKKQ